MIINYITGHAGTGKSTRLIDQILTLAPENTIIITPTHKAGKVLSDKLEHRAGTYEIKTVHSLLGWIPGINEEAKNINHVDTTIKLDRDLPEYTNIVVDEFSMMSEDMLYDLTSKIEEATDYESDHITLTLYGDPYQLPPVKGTPIQTDPDTTVVLQEQFRAESQDLVDLFTKFVRFLDGTNTTDISVPYSENVVEAKSIKKFKEGDRLLAYTNEAVGNYNQEIAKKFGIEGYLSQEVQLGSRLETAIVKEMFKPNITQLVQWFESGRLILQNSQIDKKYLVQNLQALINAKEIEFMKDLDDIVYPVVIGIGKAYVIRQEIKKKAVGSKPGTQERGKSWSKYYALERAFTMDYTFASTVHKSQGSEFKTVWIDKKNIQKSIFKGNYNTYARLMYVALSRAKQTVRILDAGK